MIHIAPVLVFVAALVPTLSVAADTCAPGQRRLNNGEPCIPETLFNYLYCLKKSGDGKVEVAIKGDSSTTRGLEVTVGGKGSGVIFKGEGSVGFKQAEANRVAKEVSERIDPSLAARCQALSRPGAVPASRPKPPIAQNSRNLDLCKKLGENAIYLEANNYHGVIGPSGIPLKQTGDGSFRFATNIVFSKKTNKKLSMDINDPIAGTCKGKAISFTRKLWDGSAHRHSGTISEAPSGAITIEGSFLDENEEKSLWSGRVDNPIP